MSSHKGLSLGRNASKAQVEFLVQFVEDHRIMLLDACDHATSIKNKLWQWVAVLLNDEGPAIKTARQWKAV